MERTFEGHCLKEVEQCGGATMSNETSTIGCFFLYSEKWYVLCK